MKYNLAEFRKAAQQYKTALGKLKGKSVLIVMDVRDEKAYYSVAPLSKAIHELGKEMSVVVKNRRSKNLEVLRDVWAAYEELRAGKKNRKTRALGNFIDEVEKKAKGRFESIFKKPEIFLESKNTGFGGTAKLAYRTGWFKKRSWQQLLKTAKQLWTEVYRIKPNERVSVGFELVPDSKNLELPLDDYLDSFAIARAMFESCPGFAFMGASSAKFSVLEPGERVSELRTTLLGCELSKNIPEPVFAKFQKLSSILKINRMETADAVFGIHGKGYGGKHLFGEAIGYPSPNRKTRWTGPGGIIYKPDSSPQTLIDDRMPKSRFAFTETLPIEIFIKTCNVDWEAMRKRDDKITSILNKCSKVRLQGKKTRFDVVLKRKSGHRWVRSDDGRVYDKLNREFLKRTGANAGVMGNLPAGEVFMTPESVSGVMVGDVVVSVDQSHLLSKKEPLVVKMAAGKYRIVSGPKQIVTLIKKKKREAWEALRLIEKNKSLPASIIRMKKDNFERIGELGINTNPKAELCDYLIVNEKIANMIHVALGAGFEPDRSTEYHYDIVIDAKGQKLGIYGVNGKKKMWILREGKFVF